MTAARLLVDTDVLIDYLRGVPKALSFLNGASGTLLMSAMTIAELFGGVREGQERSQLEAFVQAFEVVPVNAEVATAGGLYFRDYRRSHGTGLTDALIAATAELHNARLVTLNRKHFPMLSNLLVPYSK